MATRIYLPSTGAADVSPAYDSGWVTTSAVRKKCVTTKISSAMGNETGPSDDGAQTALCVQYVSAPLSGAQTVSGTVKIQALCYEGSLLTPAYCRMVLKIVSNDGTTVRGTCLALADYGPGTDWVATYTNRKFADGDTITSVNALDGDRIVLELGYNRGTSFLPTAPGIKVGDDSGTDLAEDETTTTANNPWLEFSANLVFQGAGGAMPVFMHYYRQRRMR